MSGMWGLLPILKATPAQFLRATKAGLREKVKAETRKIDAELRALTAVNRATRERTRDTKDDAKDARLAHMQARKRMQLAAERLKSQQLAEREQKAASLAARIAELNGGRVARATAQRQIVDSFKPLSERWQPRPETKYL